MAKTVTGMDDDGRIVTHKMTKHLKRSESRAIPWTEGPGTSKWKKFKRAAWG